MRCRMMLRSMPLLASVIPNLMISFVRELLLTMILFKQVAGVFIGDRHIPDQWHHRYHEDIAGDMTVREYLLQEVHPRTALVCPKGFAIAKLTMLLHVGEDIYEKHPNAALDVPYAHWLVKPTDGVPSDEERGSSKCPSLQNCLGYQGCLFNFGNEFCHMDPIPGQRKNLGLNMTCVRDEPLLTTMLNVNYDEQYVSEIRRRTQLVLHITYTSRLEEGIQDYEKTELRPREEQEGEIFHGYCPALDDAARVGYRGRCLNPPPDPVDVSEALWSLLGRVPSKRCREELQQIYCSFLYQDKGLCLPPFVVDQGQVSDIEPEHLRLAHNSFPQNGPRPDLTPRSGVMSDPHRNLIPVRLAFTILAHKDPPALMQLLGLIYRPQHYYVFHIDVRRAEIRETLGALINKLMPGARNIRILPASRSFAASWGSFNIVRAELEALEELLRMGVWDFIVKLSGADLPIRDVDDLSATLAPYRDRSFVPLFGHRNFDLTRDQGLAWDVWHGCDGYVYNVTKAGGQPITEDLPIYTGSQWSVMNRELVDYAVSSGQRSDRLNRWHYHLQTSIIPDEAYFPTIAMNSPYVNACLPLGLTWIKKFEGRNAINLCRHMEDADFCGQGPGPVEEADMREMMDSSHRYFFARKFHTAGTTHSIRIQVSEHVRTNYYMNLRKVLPRAVLTQMATLAFPRLHTQLREHPVLATMNTKAGDVVSFKVLPRLHLTNPCCSLPFERSFKSTQEFVYWVDFNISDDHGSTVGGARALFAQRPACDCYPDGHLRALRATTWPADPNAHHRSGLTINVPLPYGMPGADAVYAELWFHVGERSRSQDCVRRIRPNGAPMEFPNLNIQEVKADPLDFVTQLIDPQGNVRCEERKTDVWDTDHIHKNRDGERVEMPSFVIVACGVMEPGAWTLRVFQDKVDDPRLYELPVVILPGINDLPLDPKQLEKIDLLQGVWTVEEVALLPFKDYYGDSPKLPERDPEPHLHKAQRRKDNKINKEQDKESNQRNEAERNDKEPLLSPEEVAAEEIGEEAKPHVKDIFHPGRHRRSVSGNEEVTPWNLRQDDSTFSMRRESCSKSQEPHMEEEEEEEDEGEEDGQNRWLQEGCDVVESP